MEHSQYKKSTGRGAELKLPVPRTDGEVARLAQYTAFVCVCVCVINYIYPATPGPKEPWAFLYTAKTPPATSHPPQSHAASRCQSGVPYIQHPRSPQRRRRGRKQERQRMCSPCPNHFLSSYHWPRGRHSSILPFSPRGLRFVPVVSAFSTY